MTVTMTVTMTKNKIQNQSFNSVFPPCFPPFYFTVTHIQAGPPMMGEGLRILSWQLARTMSLANDKLVKEHLSARLFYACCQQHE